jgi:hypothetical protein
VPLGDYAPRPAVVERFRDLARSLGRRVPGGVVLAADAGGRALRGGSRPARARRRPGRRRPGRSLDASQFRFEASGRLFIRLEPE